MLHTGNVRMRFIEPVGIRTSRLFLLDRILENRLYGSFAGITYTENRKKETQNHAIEIGSGGMC